MALSQTTTRILSSWNGTTSIMEQSSPSATMATTESIVTPTTSSTDVRDESLARIEIAVLAIVFAMIIFGNVCVLVALIGGRLKMRRMYYFLLHLSIADLITGFFTVLPQLCWDITYRFYGGNFMCKTVKYLQLLWPYLSSYVLVVTAIDRYQAICFPLANCTWTARRSKLMVTIAWLISIFCCTPQLLIFSYQHVSQLDNVNDEVVFDCWGTYPQPWGERAYVTWYGISVFFIPLVILTFTYVCICREIWLNAKRTQKINKTSSTSPSTTAVKNGQMARESIPNEISTTTNPTNGTPLEVNTESRPRNQRLIVEVGANFRFRNNQKNVRCFVEEVSASSVASEDAQSRHSVTSNHKFAVNFVPRSNCCPGKLSRAKIKTIKITIVVIFCYVFCSLPFICVQLWAYWWPNAQESSLWNGKSMPRTSSNATRPSAVINDYNSSMHSEAYPPITNAATA